MSRHPYTQVTQSPSALTSEQFERVRTALRSAAGEYLELGVEELEERILPGFSSTN
jgi:hypothetical protein